MNCNICNNEFIYVEGLKFCPYCGSKLDIRFVASEVDKAPEDSTDKLLLNKEGESYLQKETSVEEDSKGARLHDTLEMPAVTDEDIKRERKMRKALKRAQRIATIKNVIKSKAVIIPFSAFFVLAITLFLGYKYLLVEYVGEAQVRKDLVGKIITLPKGTKFEVTNGNIKSFAIIERNFNREQGVEHLLLNATMNNNSVEVRGTLLIDYKKLGRNKWQLSNEIKLKEDAAVKAVSGMSEEELLQQMRNYTINAAGEEVPLGDKIIKKITILERIPAFDAGTEKIIAEVTLDSGILTAKGNIESRLKFIDEQWRLEAVNRTSEEDFKTALSDSLSEEILLEQAKKKTEEQYVSNALIFGGKRFIINDKFTKTVQIKERDIDENGKLKVTLLKENTAGALKSTLSSKYIFDLTLRSVTLNSSDNSQLESVAVINPTQEQIRNSLPGAEIEGRNEFFWWSDSHKIQTNEAKTFVLEEAVSKKGYQNIKYVYGNITYKEDGKNKTADVVALYYLIYDNSKGYIWNLDSVISSESPKYVDYR